MKKMLRSRKELSKPRQKKDKSQLEKILEYLIKYTIVPREKSPIRWQMDKIFNFYRFETEVKGKIYAFDGRHFYVYPAGCELPPGIRIGDKTGPEILLHARIDVAPQHFGELWQRVCGQHEKELQEDDRKWEKEVITDKLRREEERKRILKNTEKILEDFKRKQDF